MRHLLREMLESNGNSRIDAAVGKGPFPPCKHLRRNISFPTDGYAKSCGLCPYLSANATNSNPGRAPSRVKTPGRSFRNLLKLTTTESRKC